MATKRFAIVWDQPPAKAKLEVINGELKGKQPASGPRWELTVNNAELGPGAKATRIHVDAGADSFSFFLRDLDIDGPIVVMHPRVAVTQVNDKRDYAALLASVRQRGLLSQPQRIDAEPEETFEQACASNRDQFSPIWLGLSRDMHIFSFWHDQNPGFFGNIEPQYHAPNHLKITSRSDGRPLGVTFAIGRGASCEVDIERSLDDGVLPIARAVQKDGDVHYHFTTFVTLETQPLTVKSLRGTDARAAYANSCGRMLNDEQLREYEEELADAEVHDCPEETVCVMRVEAVNTAKAPRHAFFKAAKERTHHEAVHYDARTGISMNEAGACMAMHRLDGKAMPEAEMAVLLPPGGKVVFDMLVPHQPLKRARMAKLAKLNIEQHLQAVRTFWHDKLKTAAQVSVPEPAIDQRIKAGLLHLDLITYGKEPNGSVAATNGVYAPIGSETAPVIQFMDCMGWHNLARRALQFFLDRQRPDGFMENFGGYQLETGPVLWTMGEHYRYTRDDRWAKQVKPNILKACEYLLDWRERNRKPAFKGKGYGLQDGKVADPQDFYHSYMLNALSCVGIARSAEVLANIDAKESKRLSREAAKYREDIRKDFAAAVGRSPLIPAGDGTWLPSAPPWSEYAGPVGLYADGGNWWSHGSFATRDALIGSLYLITGEILDPFEPLAENLLRQHQELWTHRNAAFSQPYYVRHDQFHAQRGEVKAFLKLYYNQLAAMQDRQNLGFWEHYFHASPHKTHEEGWFLMQTRWMLYMERGDDLHVLPLIPRRWLADGERIEIEGMASYFGHLDLRVQSHLSQGRIEATIRFHDRKRLPRQVVLRLPHPDGRKAVATDSGTYDAAKECVTFNPRDAKHKVVLRF